LDVEAHAAVLDYQDLYGEKADGELVVLVSWGIFEWWEAGEQASTLKFFWSISRKRGLRFGKNFITVLTFCYTHDDWNSALLFLFPTRKICQF
jgi:hypothetical protein